MIQSKTREVMTMSKVLSKVKSKSREIPIDAEDMYFSLLSIKTFKKVSLERVMSFENSSPSEPFYSGWYDVCDQKV
jgi:hypothetical protein